MSDGLSSADGNQVFVSDREQVGLVPQCARAKDLCFEYNYRTRPTELERQQSLLGQLLGALGERAKRCRYCTNCQKEKRK